MTKTAGKPRQKPQRVTVTLEPHHAAELKLMADEAGVTISAFCANVLERYSLQDRQVMTTDILKLAFEQQTELMQQSIRVALNEQMNRVRSLLARTSLESGSSKQLGAETRFQNFTPLGTWLTIVPVEGIGLRGEKTSCLSASAPVPNKPSFSWDTYSVPTHV